jgi:hypothetical protein
MWLLMLLCADATLLVAASQINDLIMRSLQTNDNNNDHPIRPRPRTQDLPHKGATHVWPLIIH